MKYKYIIILLIVFSFSCWGEFNRLRVNEYGHIVGYGAPKDTIPNDTILVKDKVVKKGKNEKGQVFYGIAGIREDEVDSSKIYYSKFLYYQNKMNAAHGRQFARYEDSCMKYYKLLYQNK